MVLPLNTILSVEMTGIRREDQRREPVNIVLKEVTKAQPKELFGIYPLK